MTLTDLFGYFMFGQAVFVLVFSIWVYVHYRRKNPQHIFHITLMAISYTLLHFIIAATIVFRIFYDGWTRNIGTAVVVIAVMLGNIALARMWHLRKK